MSRLLALVAACVLSQSVHAEYYERDHSYVYKVTPYAELAASKEGLRFTAEMSMRALESVLKDMVDRKVLPVQVMNQDDLKKFQKVQGEIDTLINYLNDFVKEQRSRDGAYVTWADMIPDAYLVFGGGKISMNIGQGIGASGNIGLVVMPVIVKKYSLSTGKLVDDYFSVRTAMVAMPTVDAGWGLGGGMRFRAGIGLIWDMNHSFTNPEQFWGGGVGASFNPPSLAMSVNVKTGTIANWENPQRNYFAVAMAALEMGPGAEATTPRANLITILNGVTFLGLFNDQADKMYRDQMKDLTHQLDEIVRQIGPIKKDRQTDNDRDERNDDRKDGKDGRDGDQKIGNPRAGR